MKKLKIILPFVFGIVMLAACTKQQTSPTTDPPADHTISKDGFLHKSGLNDPLTNCVACHGSDLKGGSTGVSCFQCHGTEW